jgi:hypothetical protein
MLANRHDEHTTVHMQTRTACREQLLSFFSRGSEYLLLFYLLYLAIFFNNVATMFCDADLMNFFRTALCAEGTFISLTSEQLIMAVVEHAFSILTLLF